MNPLVHLLRFFTTWFGLTQSRPEQEQKHALLLALILAGTGLFVVAAVVAIMVFVR